MKRTFLGIVLLLSGALPALPSAAEETGVIPLRTRPGPSVGENSQMTYNNAGAADGAGIFYRRESSRLGIGVENPAAALDVNGGVEAMGYSINGEPVGTNTANVIAGRLALGGDASPGYLFGDNTFVLLENNLRIYFSDDRADKSNWRIKANDSAIEGRSYFAVYEVPKDYAGEAQDPSLPAPFEITSTGIPGPQQTMVIRSGSGNIGIGTTDPVSAIQVGSYAQLTPVSAPPAGDCDQSTERGRLQVHASGVLFICTDFGWLTK
jgi:hypothetical protein